MTHYGIYHNNFQNYFSRVDYTHGDRPIFSQENIALFRSRADAERMIEKIILMLSVGMEKPLENNFLVLIEVSTKLA